MRKAFFVLLCLALAARPMVAQSATEGLWQGYDGEWRHVSSQLMSLAEATPEEKIRLASRTGGALDQRSLHAHCHGEFLSAECHGPQDARGFERRDGNVGYLEGRGN